MSTDFNIKPVGAPVAAPIAQSVSDAAQNAVDLQRLCAGITEGRASGRGKGNTELAGIHFRHEGRSDQGVEHQRSDKTEQGDAQSRQAVIQNPRHHAPVFFGDIGEKIVEFLQ